MNNQIEQKIKSIISKLEGTLNKPSNSFLQNQERFYRIYKKLMSISIHCDTNVSAFELEEHNETSPDSSKENLETKITLNKTDENDNNSFNSSFSSKKKDNEIDIFNNKIDLDEFLNILDKDLNDINENKIETNENKINDENLKSPQNLNNNYNINENCESYFFNENLKKKFLKIEEILKNYLENKQNKKNINDNNNNNNNTKNIYFGGFRHSLDISGIFSSKKSKRNNNNIQILPNIVTNFFEDKETLKKELEEVNKRHSVVPGIEIKNYYHINSTSFKKLNKINNFNSEEVKFKTKNNCKNVSNFEQNAENSFVEGFDFLKVPKRSSLLPTFGNKNIKEEFKEFDSFYDEDNSNFDDDSNDENVVDNNNK